MPTNRNSARKKSVGGKLKKRPDPYS